MISAITQEIISIVHMINFSPFDIRFKTRNNFNRPYDRKISSTEATDEAANLFIKHRECIAGKVRCEIYCVVKFIAWKEASLLKLKASSPGPTCLVEFIYERYGRDGNMIHLITV